MGSFTWRKDTRQTDDRWSRVQTTCKHILDKFIRLAGIRADAICLYATVTIRFLLDHKRIGYRPDIPFIDVNGIVPHIDRDEIFEINSTTKHLYPIVVGRVDLQVFNNRISTNAAEGNAVQLIAISNLCAGMFDDDILQPTRAIIIICATVIRFVKTLCTFSCDVALPDQSQIIPACSGVFTFIADPETIDHHAAPQLHILWPSGAFNGIFGRGKRDRLFLRSNGKELRPSIDDDELGVIGPS